MNLKNHLKDNRRHNIVTASAAWGAIYERKKLWREKTLRQAPFSGNIMTEWGNDNEEVALQAFEKYMNDICENGNKLLVHPDLPLGASSDGFLNGVPIEIKCPFTQRIYPEIPERYYFQMQIQMCVALANGYKNAVAARFVVWTPNEFHTELVQYDPEFIEWYIPFAKEFIDYVSSDQEPPRWSRKPVYQPKEKQNETS